MSGIKKFKEDLREAGRKHPQLLIQKFEKLRLSELELSIMKLRYVDGLLIKQIPYETGRGIQWVKKVHHKATLKILDGFDVADFLELDVSLKAPFAETLQFIDFD